MSYLLDLKEGSLDPREFQEELFYEMIRFKDKILHLASYIQNDFEMMLNNGTIDEEFIELDIEEMNGKYEEALEQFRKINVKMNAIMNFYISK